MRFITEEDNDPMLSVVNLIDLFLVIIGVLMIMMAQNPLSPFQQDRVIVIENPGEEHMRITIKEGEEIQQYESTQHIGKGEGLRAGVTYRLNDGRMIYVPE